MDGLIPRSGAPYARPGLSLRECPRSSRPVCWTAGSCSSPAAAPAWGARRRPSCGPAAREVVICGRRARGARARRRRELGARAVAGDVREPADAERIVRFALERCGRLDALVNNAGGQYFVPAEAIEPKGWRAVTRLNVGGTELMARIAAELAFRPAGGGTVVNVTLSPHHGLAGMTHSSAARAAVEGLTRALAREWRGRRDRRARGRRRPLRHRVAAQVPRAGVAGGGAHRAAAAAGPRGGARLARRARRARRWAARCRARWSRSTAPATTGSGRGRRSRSPPTAARCRRRRDGRVERRRPRLGLRHPLRELLAQLLPAEVAADPADLLHRLTGPVELDHVAAALERAGARLPAGVLRRAALLADDVGDAERRSRRSRRRSAGRGTPTTSWSRSARSTRRHPARSR